MKIAAFQTQHEPGLLEQRVTELGKQLLECDELGVDIAVFPECHLTGYFLDPKQIALHALSIQGEHLHHLLKATRDSKVTAIVGFLERDGERFFNTAGVIRAGELIGCYRKIHANEKALSPGTDVPIFEPGGMRFGINICNDANYPELALQTAEAGAQILFYPLNNFLPRAVAETWRPKSPENLVARARETGCWVVSSDVVGEANGWLSYGCTLIVSPQGEIVGRAPESVANIVIADLPDRFADSNGL